MSETYRQSSIEDEAKDKVDSGNQWFWRMNRRKLSAEEMRDSVLLVSGKLNLEMGGPGFYLFNLEQTAHSPHYYYHKFDPEDEKSHRRSIYRFVVRSQPNPFMTNLDCADSSQSTPKRNETLTALQALSLLNNKFTLVMARHFADRLAGEEKRSPVRSSLGLSLLPDAHPVRKNRTCWQNMLPCMGWPISAVLFSVSVNLRLLIDYEFITNFPPFLCFPIHYGWTGLGIDVIA